MGNLQALSGLLVEHLDFLGGSVSVLLEKNALAGWLVPPNTSGESQIRAFAAHPGFPAAARRLARNLLGLAARNEAFDGIAKDAGRFAVSFVALYLDATGGITVPRLKELCRVVGMASPGRARAILLYLLFLGFAAPGGKMGRVSFYVATDRLREVWKSFLQARLDAASLIEPAAKSVAAKLDDPSYLNAFARMQGSGISYLRSQFDRRSDFQDAFQTYILDRNAGMQFLHYLTLRQPDEKAYPPDGAIPISLRDVARQLRVSRQHLMRVLRDAETAGLLVRGEGGTVQLTSAMRTETSYQVAIALTMELFVAARLEAERNMP